MIHSVSPVSFRSAGADLDPEMAARRARLAEAGKYAMPEQPVKPKKNHKFLKALAWIVGTAAVVATVLGVCHNKGVFKGWVEKASKEPVKKVCEGLETAGKWVSEKAGSCKEYIVNLLSKKKEAVADAAEAVEEAAAKATEAV